MVALYCTADRIGTETGGGIVTSNELQALGEAHGKVEVIDAEVVTPTSFGLPDTPFLSDYLALEQLKRFPTPDLAHFYSGTFSHTIKFLKLSDVPVAYTCPAHDRRTTIEEFERNGYEYPYPHIKDEYLWELFSGGLRQADIVIAPSNLAAGVLDLEGCGNIQVIPHGCELPEGIPEFPRTFAVGYLGQVGLDKGLIYLVTAWGKLDYKAHTLYLAGRGTETLRSLIARVAPAGRFSLMGYVKSARDLYSSCSVYVQPSVCESFGIEVLEAMANGRPVIVSEGAGASDLITEGVDGFVVPLRDPGALAERIDWCRQNQDKLPEMGLLARMKAEQYSWSKIRERYHETWNRIKK